MFNKRSSATAAVLMFAIIFSMQAHGMTPAGTQISNQITATYTALGQDRQSASNIVYISVGHVPGGEVGPAASHDRDIVAGQVVHNVHTVKNTGNGPDTFSLQTVLDGTMDNVNNLPVLLFHDINGNGVINSNEPEVTELLLGLGEQANIIARFPVPSNAINGDTVELALRATSQADPNTSWQSAAVTYTVVDADVVTAVLEADRAEIHPAGLPEQRTITYTLHVANQTSQAISSVNVELMLPTDTAFVAGSLSISSGGSPGGWPAGSTSMGPIPVGPLASGQTVVITYQVEANSAAEAGYIHNKATVQAGTAAAIHSNEIRTLVRHVPGIILAQTDDPAGYTVNEAKIGHEYAFAYSAGNVGNGSDTVQLETALVDNNGHAIHWPVQLYKSDGVTPLPRNDGVYVLERLGKGGASHVVAKVWIPVHVANGSGPYELEITAVSQSDRSVRDSQMAAFTSIKGAGTLINVADKPRAGKDEANPGAIVEYAVTVTNTGPVADTFDLIGQFPADVVVEFFDAHGNPITEVALNPNATTDVTLRLTIPANAPPARMIEGDVISRSTNNSMMQSNYPIAVEVNDYINFTVAPARIGAVNQGSFATYEFIVTNAGNADKLFSLDVIGATRLAYEILDSSGRSVDQIFVAQGESKHIQVRVVADYTVTVGWTESVRIVAETDSETRDASLTVTVTGSELEIIQQPSVSTQLPGGTMNYLITATNISVVPLDNVIIYAAVPTHTEYVSTVADDSPVGITVEYSRDGGATWTEIEPQPADRVTNLRYKLDEALAINAGLGIVLTVKIK